MRLYRPLRTKFCCASRCHALEIATLAASLWGCLMPSARAHTWECSDVSHGSELALAMAQQVQDKSPVGAAGDEGLQGSGRRVSGSALLKEGLAQGSVGSPDLAQHSVYRLVSGRSG